MAHAEGVVDRAWPWPRRAARRARRAGRPPGCTRALTSPKVSSVIARLQSEDREHGVRPEDAAAGKVPVPQAAAAAVERGVDAAAHRFVDHVGFARARRLPVEGKAEDQQHEAGGGGERDGQRGVGAPGGERVRASACTIGELAVRRCERAHRAVSRCPVGERNLQHAGRWRAGWSAAGRGRARRAARARRMLVLERRGDDGRALRHWSARTGAGDDHAVGVGDHHAALGSVAQAGIMRSSSGLQLVGADAIRAAPPSAARRAVGDRVDCLVIADRMTAMVEHLHDGADADRQQECDDQCRHGASQRRLGGQQPPIRGFRDRLGQSLDGRQSLTTRSPTSARAMPGLRSGSPSPSSEGCAASLRITFDWNRKMAICRGLPIQRICNIAQQKLCA